MVLALQANAEAINAESIDSDIVSKLKWPITILPLESSTDKVVRNDPSALVYIIWVIGMFLILHKHKPQI